MDKLKAQLAPVLRNWFWIAAGLVLIGSVAIWWLASGKLVAEFESAESKIKADAASVQTVSSKLSEHPNTKTHAEMEKLIKGREQEVIAAWQGVYDRQQDILVWPVAELKDDFVREFKDLTPIELKVQFPTPEEEEKETAFLVRYRDYIGTVLPGIAEIAKTEWTADFDRSAGAGGMGGASMGDGMDTSGYGGGMPGMGAFGAGGVPEEGPLVNWSTASQEALLTDLFPWRGGQPTTLQVLYSQENLWILRQMMQIVASVNGDAGQRFQAKIHDINRIAIGSSVSTTAGSVSKPSKDGVAGGDMMGGMGDYESMGGGQSPGMDMDPTMSGIAAVALDPGDNRYVDISGKPVLASQLRSALSSNAPADAFMAVAKRIPVMMSLKMDQRAVPELLAKCGSAQLMVEVRQVRILASGSSSAASAGGGYGGGGGGGYGGGGGGYDTGGGMEMGGGQGMDGGGMMSAPGGNVADQFPLDLDVEIYGIIYIYNPPSAVKLGVKDVTEDTVIDGTAMVDGRKVEEPTAAVAEPVVAPEALPAPSAPSDVAPADVNAAGPEAPAPPGESAVVPPGEPAAPSGEPAVPPGEPAAPPVDAAAEAPPAAVPPAAGPPAAAGAHWDRRKLMCREMTAVA